MLRQLAALDLRESRDLLLLLLMLASPSNLLFLEWADCPSRFLLLLALLA